MKKFLLIITTLFSLISAGQTSKLEITKLTGNYYIYTTYHTYKNEFVSANGLYLVTSNGVVMIDTPWDTTQFQPLLDSIKLRHNKKVVLCIATHSHEDRSAGLEYYTRQGIKTYTSKQTDEISIQQKEKRAKYHFLNDTTFIVGNDTLQTFYPGEGHTKDNIIVWFPQNKILHGGCFIKSSEAKDLGYTKEANLQEWLISLKKVQKNFPHPTFIIPGHQNWKSLNSIDHTLSLLEKSSK